MTTIEPEFDTEKQLVRSFYADLDGAEVDQIGDILARYTNKSHIWRGYHPFGELRGAETVATEFWRPLRKSLSRMQRRLDVFMAGRNEIDGFKSTWVVSMGHLMGLFDAPWLGIPATRKMAFLRYAEFHRVSDNRITETAMFFDIPHLMMQAGLTPFAPQTGAHLVQPGPMTHDGLLFSPQNPGDGKRTLRCINKMIQELGNWRSGLPLTEELSQSWHDDMIWWGPAGIGASYTIERYATQHAGPFRRGFHERDWIGHVCRLAEGHYGGFFGWPNFTAVPAGGFMGMPRTDSRGEFRVIDIYRRRGDKLAENWVFIDLPHFWHQQGVDILARTCELAVPDA